MQSKFSTSDIATALQKRDFPISSTIRQLSERTHYHDMQDERKS
jgi:hypothetical protein